jgi:glycosyltransferase involved in cell wall biosynthesis
VKKANEIGRVCRLAWDYPFEGRSKFGLQPVFVNLSEAQARQGYEVHVIALRGQDEPKEEEWRGVLVHRMDPPFTFNAARRMQRLFHEGEGWIVHTHSTCGFFLSGTKRFRRFPMVCHVHGTSRSHHVPIKYKEGGVVYDYKPLSVTYNMMRERLLWASGDRILTVSSAIKDDLVDYYRMPEERVRVVYNGVDTVRFAPRPEKRAPGGIEQLQGRSIILFVGHFGLRKGLMHLIAALPAIKKEITDAHLLCIGGVPRWLGGEDYWGLLRSQISTLGLEKDVTLLDAVDNSQLPDYYALAKLLALPSYYESFSKVTVEAMACELPVVATRAGGLSEVVDDGKTGILVEYGDVKQLATAIIRILSNPSEARQMGLRGRMRALQMFTWQSVAERIKRVYDSITEKGN